MSKEIQIGALFGYWQVIAKDTTKIYHTICLCTGCHKTQKSIRNNILKRGISKSCGCKKTELRQDTCLEKYGQPDYTTTKDFKTKSEETCLKKYGKKRYTLTKECSEKKKQTCLAKYGTTNYTQSEQYKKDILDRFGTEHYTQSQSYRGQQIESNNILLMANNTALIDWYRELADPKPCYAIIHRLFTKQGEEALKQYIQDFTKNIYSTEFAFIKLLENDIRIEKYDRTPIEFRSKKKPDFRLTSQTILYVNVDGLFSHSIEGSRQISKGRRILPKKYHLDLVKEFKSNNQTIFQFREDELRDKPDIIRSIILNHLQLSPTRLYARRCKIRKVSSQDARIFLENNHLMGNSRAATAYGLYYNTQLVSLMSIRKKKQGLDIVRFCTNLNTTIVGGFSKLLQHIEKEYSPAFIQSFLDLRYSTGVSYEKTGFNLETITLSWRWTDLVNTYHRLRCRANMDERKMTQAEYAKELKWYKIYDAGQAKYVKYLN